jgi:hypothetical protein
MNVPKRRATRIDLRHVAVVPKLGYAFCAAKEIPADTALCFTSQAAS